MKQKPRNLAASVRQRLLNLAGEKSEAFDLVLTRFALERMPYRIGRSQWRDKLILKGAMLFSTWHKAPYRPTRDMDLLAFGPDDLPHLENVFKEICELPVEDDGIIFQGDSIRASEIRGESEYQGIRLQMVASLAGANIGIQIDVGFGDIVILGCFPDNA